MTDEGPPFEIVGPIRAAEQIAAGSGVRVAPPMLRERYGGQRWRKMKGVATVQSHNGQTYEAEVH